ncbi:renin-like [Periplaneta americana]|uniref:renin-like n=1 Tax=Periplaneta americana TaxID=6978 RepID=UPI0037E951C2
MTPSGLIALLLLIAAANGLLRIPFKRKERSESRVFRRSLIRRVELKFVEPIYHEATIYVGEDRLKFTVQLDTGSSTLVLPSAKCDSCFGAAKFQCQKESNHTANVTYVLGEGFGRFCEDEVWFAGLKVAHQQMLLFEEKDKILQSYDTDGVVGLRFTSDALSVRFLSEVYPFVPVKVTYAPTPLIKNIQMQGLVERTAFAFHFTKDGGEFTLGGSDRTHYVGNLAYADIIPFQTLWSVRLDGFHIGSTNAGNCDNEHCSAVIDSGSSFIWAPDSLQNTIFLTLHSMVPGLINVHFRQRNRIGVRFYVLGNQVRFLQPLHITIAGRNFTLQPEDYISPSNINGRKDLYRVEIVLYPIKSWTLGMTFMRKVFTEFDVDKRRIGFAPSN